MAPFELIADDLRRQIQNGRLSKGEKLPSNRELSNSHKVAVMTAQKAVRLLVEQGWAVSRGSVGTYVSQSWDEIDQPVTLEHLAEAVAELQSRVQRLEQATVVEP
jgi:DNA-binding GntR family transcriptional regulator